ncbi:MAG: metallopeptidase family protein [Candidatus Brocadiaceae bacterium]|nr:metallopeptidase family protein [Candidatus Brocadiaceae bacterium]
MLQCFYCGQPYHLDEQKKKNDLRCFGCGMELTPLTVDESIIREKKGFPVVLGFFTITTIVGALGGVMLINGWNFWVTFFFLGGIIYFVGKIFMSKYYVYEKEDSLSNRLAQDNSDKKNMPKFDRFVIDAIHELPENLKKRLLNVAVVVEDRPSSFLLEKLKLLPNRTLLGVFQGIPLNKKSVWHSGSMPERITLFQKNIETLCHSEDEIKDRIGKVIRHEVAHFVGFTEDQVREMGY